MCSETGQSLMEVVVASAVGILVVTALVFATLFSLRNASYAKNSAQATKLAQEGIEKVKNLRDSNGEVIDGEGYTVFNELLDRSLSCNPLSPNCCFAFRPLSVPISPGVLQQYDCSSFETIAPNFQRQVKIEGGAAAGPGIPPPPKKVTVIVKWTDTTGEHNSIVSTILRKL